MEATLETFLGSPNVNAVEALEPLKAAGIESISDIILLTDSDLAEMGVRIGPRRRLLARAKEYAAPPTKSSDPGSAGASATEPSPTSADSAASMAAHAAANAAATASAAAASEAYRRGVLDAQQQVARREMELKGAALGAARRGENKQFRTSLQSWLRSSSPSSPHTPTFRSPRPANPNGSGHAARAGAGPAAFAGRESTAGQGAPPPKHASAAGKRPVDPCETPAAQPATSGGADLDDLSGGDDFDFEHAAHARAGPAAAAGRGSTTGQAAPPPKHASAAGKRPIDPHETPAAPQPATASCSGAP
jgi:hypothetical protein